MSNGSSHIASLRAALAQALKDGAIQAETSLHHERRAEALQADNDRLQAENSSLWVRVASGEAAAHLEGRVEALEAAAQIADAEETTMACEAAARPPSENRHAYDKAAGVAQSIAELIRSLSPVPPETAMADPTIEEQAAVIASALGNGPLRSWADVEANPVTVRTEQQPGVHWCKCPVPKPALVAYEAIDGRPILCSRCQGVPGEMFAAEKFQPEWVGKVREALGRIACLGLSGTRAYPMGAAETAEVAREALSLIPAEQEK